MRTRSTNKKRVIITITPIIYNTVKTLEGNFSATVEKALKEFIEAKRKKEIRENLLSRANDKERDALDLEIAEDFFYAESELDNKL